MPFFDDMEWKETVRQEIGIKDYMFISLKGIHFTSLYSLFSFAGVELALSLTTTV